MNKLSRIAVAAVAAVATTPALVATPAAATPVTSGPVSTTTVTVMPAMTKNASAWCRIFPRLCKTATAPSQGPGTLLSR